MTQRNREREAACEFGRKLGDPGFRDLLAAYGFTGAEQDVVVALDETTVGEIVDKVFTRCRPPALVAVRRPAAQFGFLVVAIDPSTSRMSAPAGGGRGVPKPAEALSENTSIGMLIDSMPHTSGTTFQMGERRSYQVRRLRDGATVMTVA